MNRIHRSLWNAQRQTFVAVSEHACSAGRGCRSGPGQGPAARAFALTTLAACLLLAGAPALAGPSGAQVVAGQATISGTPGA